MKLGDVGFLTSKYQLCKKVSMNLYIYKAFIILAAYLAIF